MANTVAAALPAHSLASMLFSGGDPRVRHWALMGSPAVIVSILAGYLYFSLRLGPALMKNRRPFHIRPLVVTYNVVMVTLSVYFFALTLKLTYLRGSGAYSLFCQGTDGDSTAMPLLYHGWFYMLMKVGELLDTVFFVLLKKNGHISFLHLLHHSVALSTVWLDINNGITGQVAMFPILNTAVHMVMYTYYGLAALPPRLRPNLWWKKYVTQIQIVQFFALMMHGSIPFFHDCGFPLVMASFMVFEAALFTGLFSDFYYRNYIVPKLL
ncbi:elongation of very long chain fatty acids protein 1-like [Ixodes scapularis]|uniref:elongation of very long chain fatty acids protein 1-like n=1 Tax=Ixodes scapularis TaxID=6945 RepID=UPI001A9D3531|nr:elongation of very long chain fatty acids protein 1-like [Ixodes scapularis]